MTDAADSGMNKKEADPNGPASYLLRIGCPKPGSFNKYPWI